MAWSTLSAEELFSFDCPNPLFRVALEDTALVPAICNSAELAQNALSICGFEFERAIEIVVSSRPGRGSPLCLAAYHCDNDVVELLDPNLIAGTMSASDPLSRIPYQELITSLLAHEMVHAWVSRSKWASNVSRLEDEYIAYALQLEALPHSVRRQVIESRDFEGPSSLDDLTEWVLFTDATGFGVLAWQHFSATGNGCRAIEGVLDGSVNMRSEDVFHYP